MRKGLALERFGYWSRRAALGAVGGALFARAAGAQTLSDMDARFDAFASDWISTYFEVFPIESTILGAHGGDERVNQSGRFGRDARRRAALNALDTLNRIDRAALSRENEVDAAILVNELHALVWSIDSLQEHVWDPLTYQQRAGDALYGLLARDYAPAAQRLRAAERRMGLIPADIFLDARRTLDPARVPRVHAETYARQNEGLKDILTDLIAPQAEGLPGDQRRSLARAMDRFSAAVDDHQRWIERELVPNAQGNERIGAALFDQKLRFTLNLNLTRQEVRATAELAATTVRREMYRAAVRALGRADAPLQPSPDVEQATIRAALELAANQRPGRADLASAAESGLAQATTFVSEHDLVTLPADPVRVIPMPAFRQGVAVAYCDAPGPFEEGQATYYAVSPIPDAWSDEQATSFLREYNTRMLADIAVHEAMPGHYVQIAHGNQARSRLRAMYQSGVFVEGWACYAEEMMAQQGFKGDDPLYRLTQLKVQLRTVTNAILDQMVHVDNASEAECMRLMRDVAFQEEREAAGKWVRARVSSTQLSTYFVGLTEHLAAREAARARAGAAFDLKRYHDGILAFGAPPVRYARALLLGEPII